MIHATLLHLFAKVFEVDAGSNGIPKTQISQGQVTSIASGIFALAGALGVIFVIVGGIRYALSQGDPGQTQRAKNTILYSVVGLVVIAMAFSIVQIFTYKLF